MAVKTQKITDLTPDSRNANKGTQRGLRALDDSLRQLGAGRSILVDKAGRVIAGNKTLERAADVGMEDVIIVESDGTKLIAVKRTDLDLDGDDGKARKLAYADNRVAELDLDWDVEQIAADLADGLDLSGIWDDAELADLLPREPKEDPGPQLDKAEELREKWGVESGQMWQLGEHRLICGDCTDAATVARVMGGEKADLLVTDPPYGVSYGAKNIFLNAIGRPNSIEEDILGDQQTPEQMSTFWINAFSGAREYIKPGGCYYVTGPQGGDLLLLLLLALRESGFPLRHMLVWAKNQFVIGRSDYHYQHEPIIYGWVEGAGHHFYGDRGESSLWQIDKPHTSKLHPTMKPVELYERAIRNSTQVGELILDPFVGSGTSIVAGDGLGRKARASELDPGYCAVTLERWSDMTGETPILLAQTDEG